MAKKKKKRGYGYALFLAVYVLVVLFGAYKVLGRVWVLAEEYEASRPAPVIEAYIRDFQKQIDNYFAGPIAAMEHPFQTDEECVAVIRSMLSDGVTYQRAGSSNGGRTVTYNLNCPGGTFGTVTMSRDPSKLPEELVTFDKLAWFTREELTPWTMGEAEFFLDGLYTSLTVTVPKDYFVSVNGHVLGDAFIVEDGIHYDVLEKYYKDFSGLPVKCTYSTDKIFGKIEPVIYNSHSELTAIDPERDDSQFMEECSQQELDRLASFCEGFQLHYIEYISGKYEVSYGYSLLRPYIKSGSDIDERMLAAQDGLSYAHTKVDFTSAWFNSATRLKDGVYICDVGSAADVTGPTGFSETVNNMRLIVLDTNGDLRVVKQELY